MNYILSVGVGVFFGITMMAQSTLNSTSSLVSFDAGKNIEAKNKTSKFILRTSDNVLESLITIKDFMFPNSLMQEHFNENYIESDKYPEASFSGMLINFDIEKVSEVEKKYEAQGKLKIHGVEKQVTLEIFISEEEGKYQLKSDFKVQLEEYKIKIPRLMFVKIAEEAEVKINTVLE